MMDAYRSFGHYHCPMCFCRREFIAFDEQVTDPGKAECEECGYQFGNRTDELHVEDSGTNKKFMPKTEPVLSPTLVEKAKRKRLEEHRRAMLSSGVRREDLQGGTRSTPHRR